jgi:hypothetical protein
MSVFPIVSRKVIHRQNSENGSTKLRATQYNAVVQQNHGPQALLQGLAVASASTQSSIPPPPRQELSHWPIPSIHRNPPIGKRIPLVEKRDSDPGATNVPVEQLSFSPYNTRQSPSRDSAAKQRQAASSTSLGFAKAKTPRKRVQPGDENSGPARKNLSRHQHNKMVQ